MLLIYHKLSDNTVKLHALTNTRVYLASKISFSITPRGCIDVYAHSSLHQDVFSFSIALDDTPRRGRRIGMPHHPSQTHPSSPPTQQKPTFSWFIGTKNTTGNNVFSLTAWPHVDVVRKKA